jgi:hypothetical protein
LCPIYRRWKVYRPKEEARQIIQGILRAVHEFHSNDYFHGFLNHTENFLIRYDKSMIGRDCKDIKHMFLIHENVEVSELYDDPSKKNDLLAISHMIFNQIPGGKSPRKYPQDLQNLCELLKSYDNWELIVNHPSLWHWKSRIVYIECVWMHYKHANRKIQRLMNDKFWNIPTQGWEHKVCSDSFLDSMFMDDNGYPRYRPSTPELLRYVRNVHVHYKENLHLLLKFLMFVTYNIGVNCYNFFFFF